MTLHGLGSAEAAGGVTGTTFARATANDVIVTTPVLDGDRAYKVDPVGGVAFTQTYGWNVRVDSQGNQRLMLASAIIRIEDFWDEPVSLMELGTGQISGAPTRRLNILDDEKLLITDKDDDEIGDSGAGYLTNSHLDVSLWFLWLYDQRSLTGTRDMLWVYKDGAWDLAIDVTGHGNGVDDVIAFTMGTHTGKGPLPTTGGPFYFVNAVLQNLLVAPNGGSAEPKDDAKGSFACKVRMPSANGTYGDFDVGVGAHAHPDWRHVDEIPSNDATDYDEGDIGSAEVTTSNIGFEDANPDTITLPIGGVGFTPGGTITVSGSINNDGTYTIDSISGADPWVLTLVAGDTLTNEQTGIDITITQVGDKQSYAIADAGGGEAVLAVQVVGAAFSDAVLTTYLIPRPFIYDGTTRQNLPTFVVGATWFRLNDATEDVTLNQINGVNLSESLFNDLEAGLEITAVRNRAVLRDSQMAIEYAIPGPKLLPSDFPLLGDLIEGQPITRRRGGTTEPTGAQRIGRGW